MSVAKKLALSFGVLVALLAGVCMLGYLNVLRTEMAIERTMGPAQARHEAATTLLNRALQQDVAIRNIGLFSDPPAMQREARVIGKLAKETAALVAQLEGASAEQADREDIEAIKALAARAEAPTTKAVKLALAFQAEDAVALLGKEVAPLSVEKSARLTRLAERQSKHVEEAAAAIKSAGESARWLLAACGVIGLVLAAVCGWLVTRSVTTGLAAAVEQADRVAAGDLGARVAGEARPDRSDEFGRLQSALDLMAAKLRTSIDAIRHSSNSIHVAASEIASGSQDLSGRTEQQAAALQQTAAALQQLTSSVDRSADMSCEAETVAQATATAAGEGGRRLEDMVRTMGDSDSSSQRMSEIVHVIDGLAFQTNILALNASFEAARAGEQGRGFSVVASEVRSLAQRAGGAAAEIKSLIGANLETVAAGSRVADQAQTSMRGIVESSHRLSALLDSLRKASREQADGVLQASQAATTIDQGVQQNAALVEQSAAAAESLKQQTHSLNDTVSCFRV